MRVGILAIQGDFKAHSEALEFFGHTPIEVRSEQQLTGLDALILPGGESTTMLKLLTMELEHSIINFANSEKGILATCAGLILIANKVQGPEQRSLNLLPITVERNAYGRQINSFITDRIKFNPLTLDGSPKYISGTFIRAPRIITCDPKIEILGTLDSEPILIKHNKIFGCSFHPELSFRNSVELYDFIFKTWSK